LALIQAARPIGLFLVQAQRIDDMLAKQKVLLGATLGIGALAFGGAVVTKGEFPSLGGPSPAQASRTGGFGSDLRFPEEDEFLAKNAQTRGLLQYAQYLRPEVGMSDADLGMPLSKYRDIERRIAAVITAEDPTVVASRIKREKFGITNITSGTPFMPQGVSWEQWDKIRSPEQAAIEKTEVANIRQLDNKMNGAMAAFVLEKTDEVLRSSGIEPQGAIRAKAFVDGTFYLFKDVPYASMLHVFGDGTSQVLIPRGVFAYDVPRGSCWSRATTMALMIEAADPSLKVQAHAVHTDVKSGNIHGYVAATVHGRTVGYDPTWGIKIDTRDPDTAALWVLSYTKSIRIPAPFSTFDMVKLRSLGDPISTLPPAQWQSAPGVDINSVPKSYSVPNINPEWVRRLRDAG
jgi:hypothetical protein